jgi:hypothetical protein
MALDTSDPEAVRAAAREILSQSEYTRHELTWWRQLLYYATHPWEALADGMDWFFGQLVGRGPGAVIAWFFVVALIGGLIFLIVTLTRSTTRDNAVPVGMAPSTRDRTPAEFLAEAERMEAERRWRQAIRMRYAALLAELGQGGFIRLRPGRTTGEYVVEVRANLPDASDAFESATRVFERAWYGKSEPSNGDLEQFKDHASGVKSKALV